MLKPKLRFCISFILIYPLYVNSQITSFAPLGSTWYYTHEWFYENNNEDYTKIETIGDTVIEGKLCSILFIDNAYTNAPEFPDSIYLYSDSGKVYRYFSDFATWGLQYDFNAFAGDTLIISASFGNLLNNFDVVIDSTDSININGVWLRTLTYRTISNYWEDDQKVIEHIGGSIFLFPTYTLAENTNYGLRCYSDSIIGYYNSGIVSKCDSIVNSVQEINSFNTFSVFPTIFSTAFTIHNLTGLKSIVNVFDESLSDYGTYPIEPFQSKQVDLRMLPEGLYFVRCNINNFIQFKKIIKFTY